MPPGANPAGLTRTFLILATLALAVAVLSWAQRLLVPLILAILFVFVLTPFVIVMVMFMLVMREDLRGQLLRMIGNGRITHTTKVLDDVGRRISRYLVMQSAINIVFAGLVALGLHLIGLPYALLWGFLAGMLR